MTVPHDKAKRGPREEPRAQTGNSGTGGGKTINVDVDDKAKQSPRDDEENR